MWVSKPSPTTANDLVMPRMRAVAGAWFLLMNTIIGLALGPYLIGKVSDLFIWPASIPQGRSPTPLRSVRICSW